MHRILIAGLCLLTLAACASPYTKVGAFGGYDDMQVGPNMYRISVEGNGYTTEDRAERMALLRASEITLAKGFEYFSIVSRDNDVQDQMVWGYGSISRPRVFIVIRLETARHHGADAYHAQTIKDELEPLLVKKQGA